jgi:SprT protein
MMPIPASPPENGAGYADGSASLQTPSLTIMSPRSPTCVHASQSAADVVRPHLPTECIAYVDDLLNDHSVVVRLSRRRATKLGDHRPPSRAVPWHRISINEDLNPYAFLVTLLHEVAHMTTHAKHRKCRRLRPHGPEWQGEFAGIMRPVVAGGYVPGDVTAALQRSLARPKAATCSDRELLLSLARYDHADPAAARVEDLAPGTVFRLENGRRFCRGHRVRTRFRCIEIGTGHEYRVHGLVRVTVLERPEPEA